jgi:hypothetical protein
VNILLTQVNERPWEYVVMVDPDKRKRGRRG